MPDSVKSNDPKQSKVVAPRTKRAIFKIFANLFAKSKTLLIFAFGESMQSASQST